MRKIVLLGLLFFTYGASANMTCTSGACIGVPGYVIAWPDGNVRIYPIGNAQFSGTSCSAVDNGKAILLPASEGQDKMYSMLLAGLTAKKSLYIRLPDNSSDCEAKYIRFHEDT